MRLFINVYKNTQLAHSLQNLTYSLFRSETVCVWMDTVASDEVESTIKHILTNVSVITINYNKLIISANMCIDNVVFKTSFIVTNKLFKDRSPTVKHVFLVIDTSTNISRPDMWNEDESKLFGSAKTVVLWKSQMFKLASPYFPPRRLLLLRSLLMLKDETTVSLRGRKVNVSTFNCSLFSIIKDSSHLDARDGIEIRMLKELAYKVNFTPTFIEVRGVGKWGIMLPNGSWVGGVAGALESGEADLGFCNLWTVLRYVNSFDFGPQWNAVSIIFLSK